MGNDIKWNFSKFLVDKQGNVVGRCVPPRDHSPHSR
jgi:glutathione peroxidase-family protein